MAAYTEKELEFMDKYSELIEEGADKLPEVFKEISGELGFESRDKLKFLLIYMNFGPNGFKITEHTSPTSSKIEGALVNLTSMKATGSPLTPALFKAKTRVVLYKIDVKSNKIESSKQYSLDTKEELNKEMSDGGYNLVILDSNKYIATVLATFSGEQNYKVWLNSSPWGIRGFVIAYTEFTTKETSEVKILAKNGLYNNLVKMFGAEFSKVYTDVLDTAVKGVKW